MQHVRRAADTLTTTYYARLAGTKPEVLRCGYCGAKLVITHDTIIRATKVVEHIPPPPGAIDMCKTRKAFATARIDGRARCTKCGAFYRQIQSYDVRACDFYDTWITVPEEGFDNDFA